LPQRPADALVTPGDALLVSDDHAGVIYRISYNQ
jgi:glucose/arabinose dehydrogenase